MNTPDYRQIARQVRTFATPKTGRAWAELATTVVPFITLFGLSAYAWSFLPWLSVLLVLPASLFAVRLFLLQHDMGHGSYFQNKKLNKWVGKSLGVVSGIPYAYWKRTHAIHHATCGNLDKRGAGDVTTWTVTEYQQASFWGRLGYRFYRHPLVLTVVAPAYMLLKMRIPFGHPTPFKENWKSILGNNVVMAGVVLALGYSVGFGFVLAVYCLTLYLAMMIGIWLFYVQHQFEEVYWAKNEAWNYHTAAIEGSSQLTMPATLRWFTANIGLHHIHHLDSRVPFYRLSEVMDNIPALRDVNKVSVMETPRLMSLTLYDEVQRRLISFRDVRQQDAAAA